MSLYANQTVSWEQYLLLEQSFLGYLRSVPLDSKHYDVWSYQLGSLTIDTGSVIDSFFRNSVSSKALDQVSGIQKFRSDKNDLKIGDYHDIYNSESKLSSRSVYELKNYSKITPFDKWEKNVPPFWWTDYNKVKHNRFENRERATLKSTLYALSALFLLNVTSPELTLYLIGIDVIKRLDISKRLTQSIILDGDSFTEVIPVDAPIHAKTELFGYIYDNKNLNFNDEEKKRILSPLYCYNGIWDSQLFQ